MEKVDSKELINRVKVMRNLIIINMQLVPTLDNRFKQKQVIDTTINLAKSLTEVQDELAKRGIFTYE